MRFLALVVAAFCATSALADEVWDTDIGPIIYESEDRGMAVFSFRNPWGNESLLMIPGLAGNYDNRGIHDAFWIGQGPGSCLTFMDYDGRPSNNWGQATLIFDTPAYPTSFTILMGDCFDEQFYSLRAIIR